MTKAQQIAKKDYRDDPDYEASKRCYNVLYLSHGDTIQKLAVQFVDAMEEGESPFDAVRELRETLKDKNGYDHYQLPLLRATAYYLTGDWLGRGQL